MGNSKRPGYTRMATKPQKTKALSWGTPRLGLRSLTCNPLLHRGTLMHLASGTRFHEINNVWQASETQHLTDKLQAERITVQSKSNTQKGRQSPHACREAAGSSWGTRRAAPQEAAAECATQI